MQTDTASTRRSSKIRQIVLRLASENNWDFTRFWGELKKLGINLGKTTLRNILKEHDVAPGPKRLASGTWDEFIKRYTERCGNAIRLHSALGYCPPAPEAWLVVEQ